ncbi:MFS transporter [Bacillus xiapuensis]|uniref:MFS transporter n=1 Tax=Bacillus xiapuensis TaxID=2014075 RepID=UPI000C23E22D|nr:MFS transporter [Bacillus xiapuensis]
MEAVEIQNSDTISRKDHVYFVAAIFCFWFAIYIYTPVFSVYLQSIGFSYSAIGFVLGSYGITQILLRFPLGMLSDFLRSLRKSLFIWGFVIALTSDLLLALFDSFAMVLIARLLAGVTAAMWVMATVLYSYYYRPGQSSKAMGTIQFITVATQFFSMAICGYLVHLWGWRLPFWLGAAASVFGIFFAWKIKDLSQEGGEVKLSGFGSFIKQTVTLPNLPLLTLLSLIAHAILFITIFGFSPVAAAEMKAAKTSFIWLISAFFIPHALASFILTIYELHSRLYKSVLLISFGLTAVLLALVPFTASLLALSAVHSGLGLTLGFIFPLLLGEVIRSSPPKLKMSAMGFYQSFYALGIFLGPFAAGIAAETSGISGVFIFTSLLSLTAVFIMARYWRNR